MKTLGRILLEKWYIILTVVCLLALQAYCELSMPSYTADIVDVGIQQGGFDSPVPERIRESEMKNLFTVTTLAGLDGDEILACYELKDGVYELKSDLGEESKAFLEQKLNLSTAAFYSVDNMTAEKFAEIEPSLAAAPFPNLAEKAAAYKRAIADKTPVDHSDSFVVVFAQIFKEQLRELDPEMLSQMSIGYARGEFDKSTGTGGERQMDYIYSAGGRMLLLALISMISTVIVTFLAARVAAFFARETRKAAFAKVLSFGNAEFDNFSTASLITRCTNDVQAVQMALVFGMRILVFAPIMGFGAFFKVMNQGSSMGWVIGIAVGLLLALVITLFTVAMPKFTLIQKLIDKLNLVSREVLTGLPVIRAFSREEYENERFDKANKDLTRVNIFVNRAMATMFPTMMFIMNGISVLIIWAGSHSIDAGNMRVGDLMAFISYTMQIIMSFLMLSMLSVFLPRAAVSAKRLGEIMDTKVSVKDPEHPVRFNSVTSRPKLEFKNVCFKYQGAEENVLENIAFSSKVGETTAIIGATGSGKSTLANLIPRFFDATAGEILIDGVNIKNASLHDLRAKIGYIPQKATLFSGTIRSNIAFSDEEMGDLHVIRAAKIAQAEEFIETKAEKYDDPISQAGANISGGQKQRLSIARAIAKNPEIYIFDDSFSALDFKTDSSLRKALFESGALKSSTVLIIAQRISTIMRADRIIVLDDGRVAGIGTHAELLKTCEAYKQIAYSQLSEKELEVS